MVVCMLGFAACDAVSEQSGVLEVSLKNSSVDHTKGQQFVNVKCAGDWTLALIGEDDGEVAWARLNAASGSGSKSNVVLSYEANTGEQSRELRLVLDNGSKWVECKMVQKSAVQQPDDDTDDPTPTPPTATGSISAKWLELPAMDNPNLGYYSHSFKMDGKIYRNYSFGWSQKDRVALWVAYPLCKLYTGGSVGRTDAWALDPLLGDNSAAPFGGYAGSYARGHQLPSADRQCS